MEVMLPSSLYHYIEFDLATKIWVPRFIFDNLIDSTPAIPANPSAINTTVTAESDMSETATISATNTSSEPSVAEPDSAAVVKPDSVVRLSLLNLICFVLSVGNGLLYVYTNHWMVSNMFGVAFSIQGISIISIGSTKNGLIMLVCLQVYFTLVFSYIP